MEEERQKGPQNYHPSAKLEETSMTGSKRHNQQAMEGIN